ncbi:hypothetical protein F0L74_31785 [Chitinophaga agrisoli]|uniref:DUF4149 domain-containing protein n=1 Tax=Chitinophaga agrisoli TaxID=2607653 RepID=A0A5B2VNU9_9BACT|nr:hypothetical protein [Chitinophaga agrisoli]KAA2240725.1 hypothetical protein F0L74_31785 [Chitinophaga agrisoli]
MQVSQPAALVCTFTWTGFVCGISFLEAWLKFRAPGITLPIGLGIGRLVFGALNKVEWVFAVIVTLSAILYGGPLLRLPHLYLLVILTVLLLQTCWLLPALDARAELQIHHQPVTNSYLHFYFIGAEFIKTLLLIAYGLSLFKRS